MLYIRGVASGENDAVDANHFVGIFVTKNDFLAKFIFFDGMDFAVI